MPPLQEWHIHARAHACAMTHRPFAEGERVASALYWRAGQYERVDMCLEAWAEPKNRLIPAQKPVAGEGGGAAAGATAAAGASASAAGDAADAERAPAVEDTAPPTPTGDASTPRRGGAAARLAKPNVLRPVSTWQSTYERAPANANEPMKKGDAEALLRRLLEEDNPAHRNIRYILALMLERKRLLKSLGTRRDEDERDYNLYVHAVTGDNFIIEDPGLQLQQLGPVQDEVAEMLKSPPV